jgi:hypothetical protein
MISSRRIIRRRSAPSSNRPPLTALDPFLPFKLGPVTGRNAAENGRSLIAREWIYEEQRLRFCYCCVGLAKPEAGPTNGITWLPREY